MRIPAFDGQRGRLAKLGVIPVVAPVVAACTEQTNTNPTGDVAAPNLFGETASGGIGFPHEVVTTEGIASASLYLPIFLIAVGIFILIEGLLLFMAWRFRRKSDEGDLPQQVHGSNRLEIVWTAIPAFIVTVLFIGSTAVLTGVDAKSPDPDVTVDVLAQQFGWTFTYEDSGIVKYGRTASPSTTDPAPPGLDPVLPVDRKIRFRLTSDEKVGVIHSFYVPAFFFKRDAIPGHPTEFELTIEKPGVYGGQCAEFCGLYHSQMFFSIQAVSPETYEAWVASGGTMEISAEGEPLPAASQEPPAASQEPPAATQEPPAATDVATLEIATSADKPIAFTTSVLEARAGQDVTIVYTNDSKVPHNIAVYEGPDASGSELAESEVIAGPGASTEVSFTAPSTPGSHFFRCEIHPLQMTGTLNVVA